MAHYRLYRRSRGYENPTRVTLAWQQALGSYKIQFHKGASGFFPKKHWEQMETLILPILKAIPYGEREYDPDEKSWYFIEKYFESVKSVIESLPDFSLEVLEKPKAQTFVPKFISLDKICDNFVELTGVNPRETEYKSAKKAFFKTSMKLHPDKLRNGETPEDFYRLNEAWQELEIQLYKTKQRVIELKEEGVETYG